MHKALDAVAAAVTEFGQRFHCKPDRIRIGEDFEKQMCLEALPLFQTMPKPGASGAFRSFMDCAIIVDPDAPITAFTVECGWPPLTLLCDYPPKPELAP